MKSKLRDLAEACYQGACNPHSIINSLPEAAREIPPGRCPDSVELKIILGRLSSQKRAGWFELTRKR